MPVQARAKHRETGSRPSGGACARRRWVLVLVGLVLSSLDGCAFWDEVTSKEFTPKEWFVKPAPMKVLVESTDGDHRQKALRRLVEPSQNGGTEDEQKLVVGILCTAASMEKQAVCRLAAIQTMSKFKDPRVVEGLKEAYYRASGPNFPPDTVHMLKCAALKALGDTGQPAAVETLVNALRQPPEDGAHYDKQRVLNERVTAARALGHFKHYQATESLLLVLQKDKDPAVRNRAHESLCSATGKDFPPDAVVWAEFLHNPQNQKAEDGGPLHRLASWLTPAPPPPPQKEQ